MEPRRILIVNVNWIGDVLFSTAAIRAIRKRYPSAYLASWVPPRAGEILKRNPHLNEVITAPDRMPLWAVHQILGVVRRIRRSRFDTAIFFHRSRTRAWIARLAGIGERWGYGREPLLTRSVEPPKRALHKIDYFLNLLSALGIPSDGRSLDFLPTPGVGKNLAALLAEEGVGPREPYAVVHAGGNWDLKRWPENYFVRWIELFLADYGGKVVLCGTEGEKPLCDRIRSRFDGRVVSLCGRTSLEELAWLMRGARILLSNDSGPLHVAASQNTKVVALFGPTSPEETGPVSENTAVIIRRDVGCQIPCYFRSCDYRVCMDWLAPEEVFERTKEILSANVHS